MLRRIIKQIGNFFQLIIKRLLGKRRKTILLVVNTELSMNSFMLRIKHDITNVSQRPIFLTIRESEQTGNYLSLEQLEEDKGETTFEIGELLEVLDGTQYSISINTSHDTIHPDSPIVEINIPEYPEIF